ncbi:hypothetical protein BFJ67_g17581 [Fusarium oxysporum f. sp. cepae]|nr:hypothetical protein BFJ67_g17581 [Fusarium oxysporum f. sp. cepae]
MIALLSQQAHDTSADLTVGRNIARGLLAEDPESQPIFLVFGQTSARLDPVFSGPTAVKSIDEGRSGTPLLWAA